MKYRSFCLLGMLLLPGCATPSSMAARTEPPAPDTSMSPSAQSDLYLGIVDGLIRQRRYEAAI
ncbi:MAG: hypothetical protein ABI191_03610, partial [Rhizomicrobium sp.]